MKCKNDESVAYFIRPFPIENIFVCFVSLLYSSKIYALKTYDLKRSPKSDVKRGKYTTQLMMKVSDSTYCGYDKSERTRHRENERERDREREREREREK